jgi:DNA-binding CsgD family transcriptional regulator/tetratricopeptide (TPR) repeat protein
MAGLVARPRAAIRPGGLSQDLSRLDRAAVSCLPNAASVRNIVSAVVRSMAQPRWAAGPSRPELVGRREELGALEDELSRAAEGSFRAVLLVGEPGVGKSRLGRELLARHRDVSGLVAEAYPLGASATFGLWIEAIDPFLQSLPDEEVVDLCGGLLDDLATVFHRVALIRGSVPERDPPLPRLLEGLANLLGNVLRRTPLVVLLDDVHFADASSWEALRFFARRLDAARLLVIATSRPAELAEHEAAAPVLFELEQDALLTRMEVRPLVRPALRELTEAVIERPAPTALVDWICARSQGNPLFAIGLLRALLDERGDFLAPHLRRLPEGLSDRVTSELRRFGAGPREMLELLAVVGRPVSVGDLTILTGHSLEEAGPILAELVDARIVLEEERGCELGYAIQHGLVRDVIYQATGGARRRLLHRRAARSLLQTGQLAEAALHFARSAVPGDPEAVEVLLDAMRQAERREAYREALALQAELVDLLPADDQRWLEVLDAMYARAEWLIDHRAETDAPVAVRALSAIDALLERSGDPARRAIVKFRLANFLAWGIGDLDAAEEACRHAHELFSRAGDRRQALLAARELAWIKGLRGDLAGMAADSRAVVEGADQMGDRFIAMQGLSAVSQCAIFRGAFAEAEAGTRRAAAIARQDEKAYRLTVVLVGRALGLALQGRVAETAAVFAEAKAANPAYRDSNLVEVEALVGWIAGDFTAALAMAREAAAWLPAATARRRAPGSIYGAVSAIETGDVLEAERFQARARAMLGERAWFFYLGGVQWTEAILAWYTRGAVECVAPLRVAAAQLLGMEVRTIAAFTLFDLAEAAADAGDARAAAEAAQDLKEVAEFIGLPGYWGMAAAGSAWASIAGGKPEQATRSARQAIELLSGTGWRAHAARCHYALGRALPADARAEAVAALERSAAILGECGSAWRRDRSLEAMRRLGAAGRRAVAAALGPESLTRREREVARLAATGMSAKEIAQSLFVGKRTVETHLASVYAKLGVDSKLQLVRRAAELGLS